MPKLTGKRYADDQKRVGMDLRTIHLWDQFSFGENHRPVAYCGSELFPRSLSLMSFPTPTRVQDCSECFGNDARPKVKTWKRWSKEEDRFLEVYSPYLTFQELSEKLGHTVSGIHSRYYERVAH